MTAPKKNNIQITNGMYTKKKKGKLHLKHLAYETSIDIPDVKTVHIIDDAGDYVLFDDDQGNDYLCNLKK